MPALAARRSAAALGAWRQRLGAVRGVRIVSARPVNGGRQLDVEFVDRTAYRFHAEWMRDSSPAAVGADTYRKSAKHLVDVKEYLAADARPSGDGAKLVVDFETGAAGHVSDEYVSAWLHAFAPYVGQPLHEGRSDLKPKGGLKGTGSLLDGLKQKRQPWGSELSIPSFDAKALRTDEALQIEFLERLADPGVALVTGVGAPQSLASEDVGLPLERLVGEVIGRLNQHPARATRYGVMRTAGASRRAGADYDHANPLSMHTDHSVYHGTPGYVQFMYQAQGSVRSKVCDGLALTHHLREHHPEELRLLSTVHLTHSSRNSIYAKSGAYRSDSAAGDPATFELVHTHPVIELDADGHLEKVVQSETKRGVCALPYEIYGDYMAAYRLWTGLVEEPRFTCHFDWPEHTVLAMNNHRILHGRATVPAGMDRTMCFGYVMKTIFENRHRLLKQRQAERRNPLMSDRWLTRVPNQVLQVLVQ